MIELEKTYDTSAIRQLLSFSFSDAEFTTFCFDFFHPVYENFASGMGRQIKIQLLIEYCEKFGLFDDLLQHVRDQNPYQYNKFKTFIRETTQIKALPSDQKRTRLEITLPIDLSQVSDDRKSIAINAAVCAIAGALGIACHDVSVLHVQIGSLRLTIEMPEEAAKSLIHLCDTKDSLIEDLGIQKAELLHQDSQYSPSTIPDLDNRKDFPSICVVGVGDGAGNVLEYIARKNLDRVDLIVVNTDEQALLLPSQYRKLIIGQNTTRGLGTGGDPVIGEQAAEESMSALHEILHNYDLIMIVACLGGGTGTGATPVIARIARQSGAFTIGIATKPFTFEGSKRANVANQGIERLEKRLDAFIVVSHDRLLELTDKRVALRDAFNLADDTLYLGIKAIVDLLKSPSILKLDFSSIKSAIDKGGIIMMSIGHGKGENRISKAVEKAINSFTSNIPFGTARSVLFCLAGSSELTSYEVNVADSIVRNVFDSETAVTFGSVVDEKLGEEVRVTIFATDFDNDLERQRRSSRASLQPNRFSEDVIRVKEFHTDIRTGKSRKG